MFVYIVNNIETNLNPSLPHPLNQKKGDVT